MANEELYIAEAITGRGSYSRRPHYITEQEESLILLEKHITETTRGREHGL